MGESGRGSWLNTSVSVEGDELAAGEGLTVRIICAGGSFLLAPAQATASVTARQIKMLEMLQRNVFCSFC